MKIISGSSNLEFAYNLSRLLHIENIFVNTQQFEDGELRVQIVDDLNTPTVCIVQSISNPANDHLIELLLITDAVRRCGVKNIIAAIPYFGYARQDRKTYDYGPISASIIAKMIELSGINQVITIDLHSPQIEGFFHIPLHHFNTIDIFTSIIQSYSDVIIVSPDAGGILRASKISNKLNVDLAIVNKTRKSHNYSTADFISGYVEGKHCFIIDDIIDTGGTICNAADLLIRNGAKSVTAFVTHAILSAKSKELINNSKIDQIYITNTIKHQNLSSKFTILPIEEQFSKYCKQKIIL